MHSELLLVPLITTVFSVLLALLPELFPPFAKWWDTLDRAYKQALRAWTGMVITILIFVIHFTGLADVGLGATLTFKIILLGILAWVAFVQGGEATYQATRLMLPRKRGLPSP